MTLISVQPRSGSAPTPSWLRERGRYYAAHRHELLAELRVLGQRDPRIVAETDQAHAGEDESAIFMRGVAEQTGLTASEGRGPSEFGMAARLGVIIAMFRGVDAHCPHVQWPPPGDSSRIAVILTCRAAICARGSCVRAAQRRWHDDARCEMCERETQRFTPYVVPIGPCVVSLELCNECGGLLQEAVGEAA